MLSNFITPSFNPRVVKIKAASYTALAGDDEIRVNGAYTVTLPAISTLAASGIGQKTYKIKNIHATSTVTISCNSADTIEDGSSGGSTTVYIPKQNDYYILEADLAASQWKLRFPTPLIKKENLPAHMRCFTKVVSTNGTTAVNVFTANGCPNALTITGISAVAKDTVAGDISLTNGSDTVSSFAKSQTAGVVTGEDGDLANTAYTAGNTLTIVSSTTGNARVTINYELA